MNDVNNNDKKNPQSAAPAGKDSTDQRKDQAAPAGTPSQQTGAKDAAPGHQTPTKS